MRRGRTSVLQRVRRALGLKPPARRVPLTDPKHPRASGIEERQLPNGEVERVFHGSSMKDALCRNALKATAEESLQRHLDAERVVVQMHNDPAPTVVEIERAEKYEAQGHLRAVHPARVSGFGPGRPGCDYCGARNRRLRYHARFEGTVCREPCHRALDDFYDSFDRRA